MPVYTRSTFGTDGLAQPIGMVADYGLDSSAAHDQSGPNVEPQQQKQPTPKEVRIAALQQAAAMVDAQIDTHKKEIARISPGGDKPRPRGTPQPRRTTAGPNAGASASSRPRAGSVGRARNGPSSSPRSTPRPKAPSTATRPSPVPMANLDHESIGDTIGRSVATALVMHSKEKTGSYIPTEEAKRYDRRRYVITEFVTSFQLLNRRRLLVARARAYRPPSWYASLAVDDACNGILLACSSDNRRQGLHGHEL